MNNPFYQPVFIGRQDAIELFYSLRTLREQKNSLYIEGIGGLGKTWLLRRYIEECKVQLRPWHSSVGQIDPVIDFYDLENRTVAGLRLNITRRLGEEYFPRFTSLENQRQELEKPTLDRQELVQLSALETELNLLFFSELQDALRKIQNYTVLFFDTFELVHNRRVGQWFLKNFLTNPVVFNFLIVFAGRPGVGNFQQRMPVNVHWLPLRPFSDLEAKEYFQTKWNVQPAEAENAAIQASRGNPLLLDLIVHYLSYLGPIEDIKELSEEKLERALIGGFLNAKNIVYEVIHEMAILKRRYDRSVFEYLRSQYNENFSYDTIMRDLMAFPFIKYRLGDESFTLHDEFQRMIIQYGGSVIQALRNELYDLVVQGWYTSTIQQLEDGPKKDLLLAEQTAYLVEQNLTTGLQAYEVLVKDLREGKHPLFNLNDMIWGEVAASLDEKLHQLLQKDDLTKETLRLTRDQANWLFGSASFEAAAYWFEQALDERFIRLQKPEDLRSDQIRLGHCYLQLGQVDKASQLWENALNQSRLKKTKITQALFAYNLGHARVRQGRWDDALLLYEEAIESAGKAGDLELKGEALFVLAYQRARRGEPEFAIHELEHGLQIIDHVRKGHVRQAQGFINAGDVYRYNGDLEKARGYYEQARQLLNQQDLGWFNWQALAHAGLGAVFNLLGIQKRERWNDIAGDLENQERAFEYLIDSLNLVRQHEVDLPLIRVLDRLADVYLEAYRIEEIVQTTQQEYTVQKSNIRQQLQRLKSWMDSLDLVEEKAWPDLREANVDFRALSTLGKAQRLFEIAFLQSDKKGEPHFMLDSLVRAASIAQIRERSADLTYYATLAYTLSGLDDPKQEKLFFNVLEMIRAHLSFSNAPKEAIECYGRTGKVLSKGGTFGIFLLRKQLKEIEKRLLSLPSQQAVKYGGSLKKHWKEIPLLLSFIESLQDLLLAPEK